MGRIIAFLIALAGCLPGGTALAQAPQNAVDRSIVILPMLANETEVMAVLAAARVWPEVAYQVARDPTIRVVDPPVMPREFYEETSAVEAAQELGARYVFMAFVSGDHVYRFDSVVRDGRTGAVVWGQIFYTDEYAIVGVAGEIGVALRLAMERFAPQPPN